MSKNPREDLANRAAQIWKGGGVSYSQAIDQALSERNPTGSATLGEKLLYALLNVDEPIPPRIRRRQPVPDEVSQ